MIVSINLSSLPFFLPFRGAILEGEIRHPQPSPNSVDLLWMSMSASSKTRRNSRSWSQTLVDGTCPPLQVLQLWLCVLWIWLQTMDMVQWYVDILIRPIHAHMFVYTCLCYGWPIRSFTKLNMLLLRGYVRLPEYRSDQRTQKQSGCKTSENSRYKLIQSAKDQLKTDPPSNRIYLHMSFPKDPIPL